MASRTPKQVERAQRNIDAIRSDLNDNPVLHVAVWPDADSFGMYLIAADGRLLPCGDYEEPVDHIDKLGPSAAEVADNMIPLSAAVADSQADDETSIPRVMVLLHDHANAWAAGQLSAEKFNDLIRLAYEVESEITSLTQTPNKMVTATADVTIRIPVLDATGEAVLQDVVIMKAGDSKPAYVQPASGHGGNPVLDLPIPSAFGAGCYQFAVSTRFTPNITISDLPSPVASPKP